MEGARKRARVMVFEIAKRTVGGTGKAIRTWAIAGYYGDVRDVSSIILIAEITGASTAPTTGALGPPYQLPPPNFLILDRPTLFPPSLQLVRTEYLSSASSSATYPFLPRVTRRRLPAIYPPIRSARSFLHLAFSTPTRLPTRLPRFSRPRKVQALAVV